MLTVQAQFGRHLRESVYTCKPRTSCRPVRRSSKPCASSLSVLPLTCVAATARQTCRRASRRTSVIRHVLASKTLDEGVNSTDNVAESKRGPLSSLPAPEKSWALVTGATLPVGNQLARLCCRHGFGIILVDQLDRQSELKALAAELAAHPGSRVHTVASDLEAGSAFDALDMQIEEWGLDVALLVANHRGADGQLLNEVSLQRIFSAASVTTGICRRFAADMVDARRGRILVVFPEEDASSQLLASFISRFENELAPSGVGVSVLQPGEVGNLGVNLPEALGSTCVDFLACENLPDAGPREQSFEASADTVFSPIDTLPIESPYAQLARERDFHILPWAEEIDKWQRWEPVEIANALLVGLTCLCFAFKTLPEYNNMQVLTTVERFAGAAFAIDYILRWYSRGLRWDFLLQKYMIIDLMSLLAFLSPEVDLNFLRLLRTARVYRLLQPLKVRKFYKEIFNEDRVEKIPKPSRLLVIRAFGAVFTLLFITAGGLYTVEHTVNPQLKDFFSSFYFSVTALSTVGFGDIVPVTPLGKLFVTLAIPVGLCLVPFQAGEVANAFAQEEREKSLNYQRKQYAMDLQIEKLMETLGRQREDAYRMAELEKLKSERDRMRSVSELKEMFSKYDADGNGSIDFPEFLLMVETLGLTLK